MGGGDEQESGSALHIDNLFHPHCGVRNRVDEVGVGQDTPLRVSRCSRCVDEGSDVGGLWGVARLLHRCVGDADTCFSEGIDVALVHPPHRLDSGNPLVDFGESSKVIGCFGNHSHRPGVFEDELDLRG